jgi:cytidylate kinase
MIIAVDGPVAAGKGTLARRIAQIYKLDYLDTGALYRAVGLKLLRDGKNPNNDAAAIDAARQVGDVALDDPALRDEATGEAASIVAANQGVRAALLQYQREFAQKPGGAVLDGRDIGTVVCPKADVKLFVTASAEVRARRRFDELLAKGVDTSFDAVLNDLQARDARDAGRDNAPLAKAADAHLLDTSKLDIEAAVTAACKIIDAV